MMITKFCLYDGLSTSFAPADGTKIKPKRHARNGTTDSFELNRLSTLLLLLLLLWSEASFVYCSCEMFCAMQLRAFVFALNLG